MIWATAIDAATGASLYSFESLIALLALTAMEIVLGIDNIVFIAIITGRLPEHRRSFARRLGLFLAMGMRVALLLMIGWLMGLEAVLFELSSLAPVESIAQWLAEDHEVNEVTGRDLIVFGGGLFLLYTAVRELHHKVEGEQESGQHPVSRPGSADSSAGGITAAGVLFRITLMDVIFSLDSVITAVGMADRIEIMVAAVIIAVGVMIAFANAISDFVQAHPTVKVLALSFLMLIAVVLISDAAGTPLSKGYVYFAMAFSLMVEFLNLRMKMRRMRPSEGEGETGSVSKGERRRSPSLDFGIRKAGGLVPSNR